MDRIGIYLRISDDRDGESTATARQKADCIRYAKSHGWKVVDTFEDVDLSAYKRKVKRPEFERMLEAVRTKEIDGVVAWKIDRITRRQGDLVRLDEACEDAGGFIATVVEGIDTRQPTGQFVAELLVAQARMESKNASIRIKRKAEERAASGAPSIGGTRAFGYTADRRKVIKAEAVLINEAAQRVLAGEGVKTIAVDWHNRGVVSPTGKAWVPTSLRQMLLSPSLAAERRLGQRGPEAERGPLLPGTWPAILTPDETRRIRQVFKNRATGHPAPRVNLLVGLARCGSCGELMVGRPREDGKRRYVCAKMPGRRACGRVARVAQPIEDHVRDAVVAALGDTNLRKYLTQPDAGGSADVLEVIRADEASLEELSADYYAEKMLTRGEYVAARDRINVRLETNRKLLGSVNGHGAISKYIGAGDTVMKQWDGQTLDWRRAIVSAVIENVTILPAGITGRAPFDPSKVQIVWRF